MEFIVFCDGSVLSNNQTGIGIYITKGNPYNTQARLMAEGFRQSSEVAKFVAVIYALQIIPDDRPIRIITDSNYVLHLNSWCYIWTRRQWQVADQHNLEFHRVLTNLLRSRRHPVTIEQSTGEVGSEKATKKATKGSIQKVHMIMGLGDGLATPNGNDSNYTHTLRTTTPTLDHVN